jgi:hypothetical protein
MPTCQILRLRVIRKKNDLGHCVRSGMCTSNFPADGQRFRGQKRPMSGEVRQNAAFLTKGGHMGVSSGDNLVRVWIRGRTAWTGAQLGPTDQAEARPPS